MPSASHVVSLARATSAALCARSAERARTFGLEMSVAMSVMEESKTLSGDGIVKGAILIAGPTASGKSALALEIAERENGVIVNADSMQIYSVLDVLTARPASDDLRRVPHELYGHVHPSIAYSTGAWLRDVNRLAGEGRFSNRRPIFVGGTGLYFRALTEGLAEIPDVPDHVRARWRSRLDEQGPGRLHELLAREDLEAAKAIRPSDGQRIVRALEVLEASGRSIRKWQAARGRPIVDGATAQRMVVEPPRAVLAERIGRRFTRMIEAGAMEEVRALLALRLDPGLPAMKAIGVRELGMVIEGSISLEEAQRLAVIATRQYAKRQSTWFRHQLGPEWQQFGALFS
jgi:tRNA dimethylallyltransferase